MKKHFNVFDKELTLTNIYQAYNKVYKTSKNKKELLKFNLNKNANLYNIFLKLRRNNYKFKKYRLFLITEPKKRIIMSEFLEDKVVNHFVANILIKYLDKSLINANLATRKNKGVRKAHELFQKHINILRLSEKEIYVLKIDIKKYFYNIDHQILIQLLKKSFKTKN